jgi:trimethylamine--corrinoid protein Co-methyltransferase
MLTCKIISSKEIGDIHDASLNILRKIGIKVNHNEVFDILGDAGAVVDKKTKIVKFPEDMVTEGIQKVGKKHTLYGREAGKAAKFGYGEQLFMSSGGQYLWIDETSGKRRPGTLEDTKAAILVGDALKEINIVGVFILPAEIPSKVRDIHLYAELIKYTGKPCFTWINNGKSAN